MIETNDSHHPGIGERVLEEAVSYLLLSAYLFVCFGSVLYLKFAILEAEGVTFAPWGFALLKALIVAKFMLVLRRLDRHRADETRPLIVPTIYKSIALLMLLVALMTAEEMIAGLIHGRGTAQTLHEMGGGTVHQKVATLVVLLLILIPFFAFRTLGDVVGNRKLVNLFLHGRPKADGP